MKKNSGYPAWLKRKDDKNRKAQMEKKEITPEKIEQMKTVEHAMQLKNLVAGEPITQRQVDAVEFLLGSMLALLRTWKMDTYEVNFKDGVPMPPTKNGEPTDELKVSPL